MIDLTAKFVALERYLRDLGSAVVAYSGGTDSALLAVLASRTLGDRALAVTADSPSLARSELNDAIALATRFGFHHRLIETAELSNPDYAANTPDRCYYCKSELFTQLSEIARREGYAAVLDGTNTDDLCDIRPGRRAACERGVRSPFVETGWTKADIREMSRQLDLPSAEKPAAACLASRLPHGTPVTAAALARVEKAEAFLRSLGYAQIRVRDHGELARVELDPADIARAASSAARAAIVDGLLACGYRYAALDLQGYRPGGRPAGT